jgi:sugar phosphate permease
MQKHAETMGFELVVYPETVIVREDAVKAVKAMEDEKIDFLMVQHTSYSAGQLAPVLAKIQNANVGFWAIPEGSAWWIQILPFTLLGFFVYGPQALLGISAANQATNRAAATANGILGIFGYASTLISGVGFGFVAQHYGWNGAYLTILIMAILGALTLMTMWSAKANGYDE